MPKAKATAGYICPKCGLEMRVIRTVKRANGIIIRRRECPRCGRLQTTSERPVGAISDPVYE